MNHIYDRLIRDRIYAAIARQEEILKIMTLFPELQYKVKPTTQQMEELVEKSGCRIDDMYHIFASGEIPDWLNTLIKELSMYWQPSGDIVDGSVEIKQISSPSCTSVQTP